MSTEGAAQTVIYCAVSEHLEGISGKYYTKCAEARESNSAKEPSQAKKLWHASLLLAGCVGDGKMVSLNYLEEQMKEERDTSMFGAYKATPIPEEKMHPMQRA